MPIHDKVVWLTGLPESGKTTVAQELMRIVVRSAHILDGDELRKGLCRDLSFSPEDRKENIRRVAELAILMLDMRVMPIVALVSPVREHRAMARVLIEGKGYKFVECWVNTPLIICEGRDTKGNYKLARKGMISDFTGVGSMYQESENPELVLDGKTPRQFAVQISNYLCNLKD